MISAQGDNLVFLLSLPRSGSTVLSLVLGSHSMIQCPPEPWFLLRLASITEPTFTDHIFDDAATRLEFLQGEALVESARAFAMEAYNSHLRASGKSIFVDKTPRYYHILPFIEQIFPKARKVWLKRNPLDVALSYKKTWHIGVDILTGRKVTAHSFDMSVGLFKLAAYFAEPSPNKFEIQYESLVERPVQSLEELCQFVGVPYEEGMLDYAHNESLLSQHQSSILGDKTALRTPLLHAQSVSKWVRELSLPELQQLVDAIGFDVIRRMGYADAIDQLLLLGVREPSETEALDARRCVYPARVDRVAELKENLQQAREMLKQRDEQIQQLQEQLARLSTENETLRLELNRLIRSTSWRITAPLRKTSIALRRILRTPDGKRAT